MIALSLDAPTASAGRTIPAERSATLAAVASAADAAWRRAIYAAAAAVIVAASWRAWVGALAQAHRATLPLASADSRRPA